MTRWRLLLAGAALGLLNSCGGQVAPEPTPGGGLAGLPAPREVSVGDSVLHMQPGTRSYLTTTFTYIDSTNSSGVTMEMGDACLRFEPSGDEQLSYTLFGISALIDSPATMDKLSLEIDWDDGVPSETGAGFYIGLADYVNNRWIWRGPVRSADELLDFSTANLGNFPLGTHLSNMALVNFSSSTARLRYVNFSTSHPDDTGGDEALFYISDDGGSSIQRASVGDLDHPAQLLYGGTAVTLDNLQLAQEDGLSILVFDRQVDGGYWEVWQAGLDGAAPQPRYSDPLQDMRFAGQNAAATYDYVLHGNYPAGKVERIDLGNGVCDVESVLQAPLAGAPRWYGNFHDDFALGATSAAGEQPQLIGIYKSFNMDQDYYVPLIQAISTAPACDISFAQWANGQFGLEHLYFFSARLDGAPTYSIIMHDQNLPASGNNRVFVASGDADLRYPSISQDNLYFSFVACAPGAASGDLYVQSALLRSVDPTAAVAGHVSGAALWYDPTPPITEE
jgi:hypothetical protein